MDYILEKSPSKPLQPRALSQILMDVEHTLLSTKLQRRPWGQNKREENAYL